MVQSMKDTIRKAINTVSANSHGPRKKPNTKASFAKMTFKGRENIGGLMVEFTRAIGIKTKCTLSGNSATPMEEYTKENSNQTKNQDTVSSRSQMVENTTVCGMMENNKASAYSSLILASKIMVSGTMVRE